MKGNILQKIHRTPCSRSCCLLFLPDLFQHQLLLERAVLLRLCAAELLERGARAAAGAGGGVDDLQEVGELLDVLVLVVLGELLVELQVEHLEVGGVRKDLGRALLAGGLDDFGDAVADQLVVGDDFHRCSFQAV